MWPNLQVTLCSDSKPLVIFSCSQMYWTKATPQKYSDQSQHQRRFMQSAETEKCQDKKAAQVFSDAILPN